jgi:hypothetical protein
LEDYFQQHYIKAYPNEGRAGAPRTEDRQKREHRQVYLYLFLSTIWVRMPEELFQVI